MVYFTVIPTECVKRYQQDIVFVLFSRILSESRQQNKRDKEQDNNFRKVSGFICHNFLIKIVANIHQLTKKILPPRHKDSKFHKDFLSFKQLIRLGESSLRSE